MQGDPTTRRPRWPGRISPTVVVSLLAVVLAAGGAVAQETGLVVNSNKDFGDEVVTSGDVFPRSVSRGELTPGLEGLLGEKTAYAHIRADGSFDAAGSHNVGRFNAVKDRIGAIYCFGLDFTPRVVLVTKEEGTGPGATDDAVANATLGSSSFCPANHRELRIAPKVLREFPPRLRAPNESVSDWRKSRDFLAVAAEQGFYVLFLR